MSRGFRECSTYFLFMIEDVGAPGDQATSNTTFDPRARIRSPRPVNVRVRPHRNGMKCDYDEPGLPGASPDLL
jgi:hypothetical protein